MKQLTSIALGFVLSVPAAGGDVYRWVDDRGQVHFGDRPPLQAQATRRRKVYWKGSPYAYLSRIVRAFHHKT